MENIINYYTFITNDLKSFQAPLEIQKMFKTDLPKTNTIQINISSFTLDKVLKYCEYHNYTPPNEIKRPLNDDLKMCVFSNWDYTFIQEFSMDHLVLILNEISQLGCLSLQELCLTKLALIIRSKYNKITRLDANINDFANSLQVTSSEFTDEVMMNILTTNSGLLTMDDDRVKELINDGLDEKK